MFGLRMLTAITLTALLVPLAGAGPGPVDVPETVDVTVPLHENTITIGPETFYVFASGEIWRETNKCAKLQRAPAEECAWRPADTRHVPLP